MSLADRTLWPNVPAWLVDLLGASDQLLEEGAKTNAPGQQVELREGIFRQSSLVSETQSQTADVFGYKWQKRDTFEGRGVQDHTSGWLEERYGNPDGADWWDGTSAETLLLDAGCGAGHSALAFLGDRLRNVRYLGVDVSRAVDVAAARFAERGIDAGFLQADIVDLPLPDCVADIIYSEGVLHHADSTQHALHALAQKLKVGGWFLFYVYRRKGPIREFTDDHIRERLRGMSQEEAWRALIPLTKLGKALGDLDVQVDVPKDVQLLEIPAGRIPVQRLFYWHVFKAFYRPEFSLDEMNHINFDWYAPQNAHRQSPEEVRRWCEDACLEIVSERIEDAGITVVARKCS